MGHSERPIERLKSIQKTEQGKHGEWGKQYLHGKESYYNGVLSLVNKYLEDPLLELGSAPYHITYLLEKAGHDVTATDLAPSRMDSIKNTTDFDVVACNIEHDSLPFKTNTVSGVVLTEVLEHLRINPINTLSEISRVLEPGGRLLITTPNLFSIYNIDSLIKTGMITDPFNEFQKLETIGHMGHVREYTPAEVQSLLEQTGFDIIHSDMAMWPQKTSRERTIKHNLGLALTTIFPALRRYQIYVATPDQLRSTTTDQT